ncbi:hypothetical protein MSPP1_003532 [Malassezia sp. CBS 17886]|nr:hypothetical protein MSPP1_003532 [Malassezia sp. CBS 17886]
MGNHGGGGAELPVELIPTVLGYLRWRTGDLAACCRTSRVWRRFATPALYERVWLRDQTRLVRVFATLAAHPELAHMVHVLELRVFPFGLPAERLELLEAQIVAALRHATHLEVLRWTRTGSLSNRLLLEMFEKMECLRELEISGNSRSWTPDVLLQHMPSTVRDLSVVLPDRAVVHALVPLATQLQGRLEGLGLLCLDSALVSDSLLESLAQHTRNLRRLSLVGCRSVHGAGVQALVLGTPQLQHLALEGLPLVRGVLVSLAPALHCLRTLTLTYPWRAEDAPRFFTELGTVVDACHALRSLAVYARGGSPPVLNGVRMQDGNASPAESVRESPSLSTTFVHRLLASRAAETLRVLRIHGIAVSLAQLRDIGASPLAARLEELVVHLFDADLPSLQEALRPFLELRHLHILSHLRSHANLSEGDILVLARNCGPWISQIGFRNRVWVVQHAPVISLRRWDMGAGTFPESMLVVRA